MNVGHVSYSKCCSTVSPSRFNVVTPNPACRRAFILTRSGLLPQLRQPERGACSSGGSSAVAALDSLGIAQRLLDYFKTDATPGCKPLAPVGVEARVVVLRRILEPVFGVLENRTKPLQRSL